MDLVDLNGMTPTAPVAGVTASNMDALNGNSGSTPSAGVTNKLIDYATEGIENNNVYCNLPSAGVTSEIIINGSSLGKLGDKNESNKIGFEYELYGNESNYYGYINNGLGITNGVIENVLVDGCKNATRPNNIGVGTWNRIVSEDIDAITKTTSKFSKGLEWTGYAGDVIGLGFDIYEDVNENNNSNAKWEEYVADIGVDTASVALGMYIGASVGSIVPGAGTLAGAAIGTVAGLAYYTVTEVISINGKSVKEWGKTGANWLLTEIFEQESNCK